MPTTTKDKVAIVTGASRGIGRGIALGLGEAGYTVYLTGRTVKNGQSDRPGSVTMTAEEVTKMGGHGIAAPCDHRNDPETEAVFRHVRDQQGRLDLLVNNATSYTTDIGPPVDAPFWELPIDIWDQMHTVGLRSHYVASICAARIMVPQRSGLIVNVSSGGAIKYTGNVSYNVVKAAVDMLTLSTGHELRQHDVAVVSLWPRLTRTEVVMAHPELFPDLSKAWSPVFTGRAVTALAADPDVIARLAGHARPPWGFARRPDQEPRMLVRCFAIVWLLERGDHLFEHRVALRFANAALSAGGLVHQSFLQVKSFGPVRSL